MALERGHTDLDMHRSAPLLRPPLLDCLGGLREGTYCRDLDMHHGAHNAQKAVQVKDTALGRPGTPSQVPGVTVMLSPDLAGDTCEGTEKSVKVAR